MWHNGGQWRCGYTSNYWYHCYTDSISGTGPTEGTWTAGRGVGPAPTFRIKGDGASEAKLPPVDELKLKQRAEAVAIPNPVPFGVSDCDSTDSIELQAARSPPTKYILGTEELLLRSIQTNTRA